MAIRRPKIDKIERWRGLDRFNDLTSLSQEAWPDALNVAVMPNGNVKALRSPANYTDALAATAYDDWLPVSAHEWKRTGGRMMVYDAIDDQWAALEEVWHFEESGSADRAGIFNRFPLTAVNAPSGVTGQLNEACQFTAASSQRLVSQDPIQIGDISFTVWAWVRLDSTGVLRYAMNLQYGGDDSEYAARIYSDASDQATFAISDGVTEVTVTDATNTLSADTWYLVFGWRDKSAGTINVQVDGNAAVSGSTAVVPVNSAMIHFGARLVSDTPQDFWNGRIDEPSIARRALTSTERSNIYNSGTAVDWQYRLYTSMTDGVRTFQGLFDTSNEADRPYVAQNVKNKLYRVNGSAVAAIRQIVDAGDNDFSEWEVGIAQPTSAPSIGFFSDGSGDVAVGLTVSYAYINQTTGDVGKASEASSSSGITSGDHTLRIATTASSLAGVDGIVVFVSRDGGSVRYLQIDSGTGDPIVYDNSTGNIDISVLNITRNLFVQETVNNETPPIGGRYLGRFGSRLLLMRFSDADSRSVIYYNGYDQIQYGTPWAAWPSRNRLIIPREEETAQCSAETGIGTLILSDQDGYLLTGTLKDKIDSGENILQITENLRPLAWSRGTRSPLTLQTTPLGQVWLDQDKQLQLWQGQGEPTELLPGLRDELGAIQDTDYIRERVTGEWFKYGDTGGFYVLSGCTSGHTNNRLWVISMFRTGEGLLVAGAPSTVTTQLLAKARLLGVERLLTGATGGRLRQIMDFTLDGAGWASGTNIYFDFIVGNDRMYSALRQMRYTGSSDLVVEARVPFLDRDADAGDDEDVLTVNMEYEGGSYHGTVDLDGARHRIRFKFPTDDAREYVVNSVTTVSSEKRRTL